jgi:magnesium-transporting ATPase (P-type)
VIMVLDKPMVTAVDNNYRKVHLNDDPLNTTQHFLSNYIRTTKYTAFSFLPMGLLNQFYRFSNVYFLCIAILQSIKLISPLNPITAILPLIFVLSVSMLREGFEDYGRYKSDRGKSIASIYILYTYSLKCWRCYNY